MSTKRKKPGVDRGSGFYKIAKHWPQSEGTVWETITSQDIVRMNGRHKRGNRHQRRKPVYFGREKTSITQMEFAYGYLIAFLHIFDPDLLERPIAERITFSVIVAFVSYLQFHTKCQDRGIANRINHLYMALLRLAPDTDWDWLVPVKTFHEKRAKPRDKRERLQPINDLYDLGIRLMTEAKPVIEGNSAAPEDFRSALRKYRNGLIIAVLATTFLRRLNLTNLRIDETIFPEDDWRIEFFEDETKTDIHFVTSLPEDLHEWAQYFIDRVRPLFPGSGAHNHLWPSRQGPMSEWRVYQIIIEETRLAFDKYVNPHLFRTSAATLIANTDPENIDAVRSALTHSRLNQTEDNYICVSDAASRRVADFLSGFDDVEY